MRVTVVATHPEVAPSTRFRIHQFRGPLARLGVDLQYDFLFDRVGYQALRSSRNRLRHGRSLLTALARRRTRFGRGGLGDVALVSREVAPILAGSTLDRLQETGAPVVYDVDDAVFLPQSGGSTLVGWLARPAEAFAALCRSAAVVLAGNDFLADFARSAIARQPAGVGDSGRPSTAAGPPQPDPGRVRLLPTVVDTERFVPAAGGRPAGDRPVVGWVGSHSTLPYLLRHRGVFQALSRRTRFRLRVVGNAPPPRIEGVDVEFVRWTPDAEVSVFHGIDVGVYPLTDDHWTRGKCGFKAIQYGACALPVVASPVGVVRDIVVPEETGLWAESEEEWVEALTFLLSNPDVRERMGAVGRARIEDLYSLKAALPVLHESLEQAAGKAGEPTISGAAEEAPCVASPAS